MGLCFWSFPVWPRVSAVPREFGPVAYVGRALLQCVVAAGPPGACNIAGDGVVSALDAARELGFVPVPVPARLTYATARSLARLPFLPEIAEWVEALSHPAIMDTTLARTQLGWTPLFSGLEALRDTSAKNPRSIG